MKVFEETQENSKKVNKESDYIMQIKIKSKTKGQIKCKDVRMRKRSFDALPDDQNETRDEKAHRRMKERRDGLDGYFDAKIC